MDKRDFGNLVNYERVKRKISVQDLAKGLCSISTIQRLESGERMPDFFVLERVIERLGQSVSRIEYLYSESVYDIYYLRGTIENDLERKRYGEVTEALCYYESLPQAKEPLHQQYICKIKAVLAEEQRQDHREAVRFLHDAMAQTLPDFALEELKSFLLGKSEWMLLLMWIQEELDAGRIPKELDESEIWQHMERSCLNEKTSVDLYAKASWVLGNAALKRQNLQEALQYALRAEKVLAYGGILQYLPQFQERILMLTDQLDRTAKRKWEKQRDALRWLYDECGEPYEAGQTALWKNYCQQEVYLISELLGQERARLSKSQEKLADILEIDQKTVSRIESGRYKPKLGTFQKMKEYLEIYRDVCSTRIVVHDFELLDLEGQVNTKNALREYEAGERLYRQLRARLPMKQKENRQYVKFMDAFYEKQKGTITEEEAADRYLEAFLITRGSSGLEQLDRSVLSQMEFTILNYYIMLHCDAKGKFGEARKILENIKAGFEKSRVDFGYH